MVGYYDKLKKQGTMETLFVQLRPRWFHGGNELFAVNHRLADQENIDESRIKGNSFVCFRKIISRGV